MSWQASIAYFSMEIALEPGLPTYAGGLGVLAGDMLHSAADDGLPVVGVSLVHRQGYFRQRIGPSGEQLEEAWAWDPGVRLSEMRQRTHVEIEDRKVAIRAWRYSVEGVGGSTVPVFLLDTDLAREHRRRIAPSRMRSTAATSATDCTRRSCSGSAGCACCASSASPPCAAST